MKRRANIVTAISLVLLFGFGIWCASLASPGSSFGSGMPGCSQSASGKTGAGCAQPSFLCGSTPFYTSFSKGVPSYLQTGGLSEVVPFPIGRVVPVSMSEEISLGFSRLRIVSSSYPTQKVPIHLFNSVLTL
ncbi:MAG: hypothetical protein ACREX3_21490 [Gammaproteobacteria bacterium]